MTTDNTTTLPAQRPGRGVAADTKAGSTELAFVREFLRPHRHELLTRALDMVREGDAHALKLLLDRLAPAPKATSEVVSVPGLRDAKTLKDKCNAVIAAVADGHVSAEAGQKLLAMLDVYARAQVWDDHEARLAAIEGRKAQSSLPIPAPKSAEVIENGEELI